MSLRSTLADFFTHDHHEVDDLWAKVESAVEAGAPDGVQTTFDAFDRAQRHHIGMEEDVLFPAFEEATGMVGGPTAVMREEHQQMRGLLDQMRQALTDGDHQEVIDQGDTLLMLIQQHNQKEEGILYPMAERVLGSAWAELHAKLGDR